MENVNQFHVLAHTSIAFIGAILLLALWYNINKNFKRILEEDESQKRLDKGLVYLSLSLFVWVFSGAWALMADGMSFNGTILQQVGINLLSTLNNLFLLLALFYFAHSPPFLYKNPSNRNKIMVAICFIAVLSIGLAIFYKNEPINGIKLGNIPDFLLSGFLSYLLLVTLYKTFVARGLQVVAVISCLAILLMFLSQLSEVFVGLDNSFSDNLVKLVSKTALIATFLVLATSWVIQLANTPRPTEMSLHFMDWSLLKMSIPSKGILNQHIDFGAKMTQYKNLLKFAIRRKYGSGNEQLITVNAAGEIKSQAYLSRIIDNLNDILADEDSKLERKDLFIFLGQSQYRLRYLPTNIHFDSSLLDEFLRDPDNQEYRSIVTNCKLPNN